MYSVSNGICIFIIPLNSIKERLALLYSFFAKKTNSSAYFSFSEDLLLLDKKEAKIEKRA